jgi:hypothetical protein
LHPILKHLKKGAKHLAKGRRELLRAGKLIVSLLKDFIPDLRCGLGEPYEGLWSEVIRFESDTFNSDVLDLSEEEWEKHTYLDFIITQAFKGIKELEDIYFLSYVVIPNELAEKVEERLRQVIQDGVDN